MLGILVLVAISWMALYLLDRSCLLVLGVLPTFKRVNQFIIGFFITTLLCTAMQFLKSWYLDANWLLGENITKDIFLKATWWDIRSVLTEELAFRGALLYILIKRLNEMKGVWITAIAFGVYHWFSYNVFGNPAAMIIIFIGTGIMGLAFAKAFVNTKSLYLSVGLHLGWNFTYNTIFSNGPLKELLLVMKDHGPTPNWFGLAEIIIGMFIIPLIILLLVNLIFSSTEKISK